ncbi:condensation domain-containing protein, partial [Microcoleus sp. B13-B6]
MNDINKRIAELSPAKRALLEQRLKEKAVANPHQTISPRANQKEAPLSFAQTRMWLLDQLKSGNPAYNRPTNIRLVGGINVAVLEFCLNEIVRRHEVLRASFAAVDGKPVQVIAPSLTLTLPIVDISNLPSQDKQAKLQQLATEEAQRPFNLAFGSLVRANLVRLGEQEHILLLTLHHIIFDGWSVGVLLKELALLYEAFGAGKPSTVSELPIQYADFAYWQQQHLQGEVLESQLAYWRGQLGGDLPVLELPTDRARSPVQTFRGAKQSLLLPKSLTQSLKLLSQREGVTLFMTLLAAFKILLHRYTGQEDIVVGAPIAGRDRIETETLIGIFINTLVLRTYVDSKLTFLQLLATVRKVAIEAYEHQGIPFEKLVEELQPDRDLSHTPLFQVLFQLRNVPNETVEVQGLRFDDFQFDRGITAFDLTLDIVDTPEGLSCRFEYNTDLFYAATIVRMAGHFQTLLEGIVANVEQPIGQLPLLTETERHQLLVEWNNTQTDYSNQTCIHQLFEAQAKQTPNAVAVVFENEQLTYQQLNCRANQLAHHLQKLGVEPEMLVGICVERSLEMMVGLLGILKAGAAYLPLDPAYPKERLTFMLEDAQVPVLLTQQRQVEKL